MNRLIRYVSILSVVIAVTGSTVLADPLSSKLKQQQSQLQQNTASLKVAQQKSTDIEVNIEKLDAQIEDAMSKIHDNKTQIASTQEDIDTMQKKIQKAEADLGNEKQLFGERMKSLYINGMGGYIDIILGSQSFSDFLSRIDEVKSIAQFDNKLISDLNNKENALQVEQNDLNDKKKSLLALESANEETLAKLNADKAQQKTLIAEARAKESYYESQVGNSQALIAATMKQIEAIRMAAPRATPNRGSAHLSNNNLIAYASNFLGTPYVWGGATPVPGFDCSGFVQYVYRHFGIYIGRTTYDQINEGTSVSQSDLQPGDIVFFGTNSNPYHEGMYIGNGMIIQAPHTGASVELTPLAYMPNYLTARRVK